MTGNELIDRLDASKEYESFGPLLEKYWKELRRGYLLGHAAEKEAGPDQQGRR